MKTQKPEFIAKTTKADIEKHASIFGPCALCGGPGQLKELPSGRILCFRCDSKS